jgi:amino acid adenylation domain-containing protein
MTEQPFVDGFALAPQQKGLFRHHEKAEPGAWNARCFVEIDGAVDVAALRGAIERVAARHEILRTSYTSLQGTSIPVQVIRDSATIRFEDCADAAALEALAAEPFDLAEGEHLRVGFAPRDGGCRMLLAQPGPSADATSLRLLVAAIADELAGRAEQDEEVMQYADLSEWMNELFETGDAKHGLDHWRQADHDAGHALRLPQSFPRTEDAAFRFETVAIETPRGLGAAVGELCDRIGVSSGTFYLSAWAALLARQTESDRSTFGVVLEGRDFEGLERALGRFERVLPLTFEHNVGSNATAAAKVAREVIEAAAEWQEYHSPERLHLATDWAPSIVFEHFHEAEPITAGDLTFRVVERVAADMPFALRVTCDGTSGEFELRLSFDPNVITGDEVRQLGDTLTALVSSAVAEPDGLALGGLDWIGAARTERWLAESCAGPAPAGEAPLVLERFAACAAATPDAVAVHAVDGELTYAELDAASNRLARHLQGLGVAPGVLVALHMDRSCDMLVAILGTMKAGGGYVPVAPDYPAERVSYVLEDSGAPVLITRSAVAGELPEVSATRIVLDDERDALAGLDASSLGPVAGGGDVAYVIYTSGTTGQPKGVVITHDNLASSTHARTAFYDDPVVSYLLIPSFAFDSSVAGIFWTLTTGGTLVLPPEDFDEQLDVLPKLVADNGVTHMLGLPSVHSLMLDLAGEGDLASLRAVLVAGEACKPALLDKHFAALPDCKLVNEYGPTEGTVWCTAFDCSEDFDRPTVPIGRPIPGAEVYVLDEQRKLTPPGLPGELCIGGPGVAKGYLNRPDLTAERFIENRYAGDDRSARLYCTGDKVRVLPDGRLEFLGRLDDQVKVRGYRIELGEIEAALAGHEDLRDCAVLARADETGERRLVAYFTCRDEVEPSSADLRAFLAMRLPAYMVPAIFVPLSEMPLNANGKIDRPALPEPEAAHRGSVEYAAPTTDTERVLAREWADVLQVERVGINDDFFEIGGHSLMATVLMARIRKELGAEIPFRTFFLTPTVAGMAKAIESEPEKKKGPAIPSIRRRKDRDA